MVSLCHGQFTAWIFWHSQRLLWIRLMEQRVVGRGTHEYLRASAGGVASG
jgi:hypothetical protein